MILAAGRGERMRPLTDTTPKPLLKIADKSLIEYHIEALVKSGINDIIINHAWLGEIIEAQLGDGKRYDAKIQYSPEGQALETAGGIKNALHLLGEEPFMVVNGDIFTDYSFTQLKKSVENLSTNQLAHLVLVNNPAHNPDGDFYCQDNRVFDPNRQALNGKQAYTFSGIACYSPKFFSELKPGKQSLTPMLRAAMAKQQVSGEIYQGLWWDIGTPERLKEISMKIQH